MAYFKIGENDYSHLVNGLAVATRTLYNSQTNAAGNTVVDYINQKRTIEVGFIPMSDAEMVKLQVDLKAFGVSISFRNPHTNALEENVACIVEDSGVSFYTIQPAKVLYNPFTITFSEL